jgi:hypothetical protein
MSAESLLEFLSRRAANPRAQATVWKAPVLNRSTY